MTKEEFAKQLRECFERRISKAVDDLKENLNLENVSAKENSEDTEEEVD